jgi:glycosyltransferase involved in cell wall biosynthesis
VTTKPASKPLKVAHITTVDLSLRYLLLNQLRAIEKAGFEVSGISATGPNVPVLEAAGVRHIAAPLSRSLTPLKDLVALALLWRILRREKFDIVHTHTPKAGLLGQYAALLARTPIRVHTIHGLYFPGHMTAKTRWKYVLLERITMLPSMRNFSQNVEDVTTAIEAGISREDRIELIGNGIDLKTFAAGTVDAGRRSAIRASLGLRDEHKIVGMVARLVVEKGYLEMFAAVKIIRAKEPLARFVFIGEIADFKDDALSPAKLAELGIDDVAQFLGHRTDVRDLYGVMDVFAHPSHREGFPRAPMEAAAMGLPVVATDIRGCRQTVDDGVNGYLVPLRDAGALAERVGELLGDEEKRRVMGSAGRAKAEREFDEEAVFARVVAAYGRMAGRVEHDPDPTEKMNP